VARIVEEKPSPSVVLLRAINADGGTIGEMDLALRKTARGRFAQVTYAAAKVTGAGIGTKLYEYAARVACRERAPLMSDAYRTKYSQGFWEKQDRKGRATCAVRSGGKKLSSNFEITGEWECGRYALRCPAPRSLRGAHE
jgi:hypothetical protein